MYTLVATQVKYSNRHGQLVIIPAPRRDIHRAAIAVLLHTLYICGRNEAPCVTLQTTTRTE